MVKQVSEATIERTRVLMSDGADRCALDIMTALNVTDTSARCAIRVLHDRKQVYVVGWGCTPGNHRSVKIYRIGQGEDVKAPTARSRKYADVVRERKWLKESRASGSQPFRNWFDIVLFGEPAPVTVQTKWVSHRIQQDMTGESLEDRRKAA